MASVVMVLILSPFVAASREAFERFRPEPVEVVAHPQQPVRLDPVEAPRAVLAVADEARVLEHAQVLRDGRPADRQSVGELADRARPRLQRLEDASPCRVAEGVEDYSVSRHLP